eukprot:753428-Hanusia_phi.AAC.1
MHEEEELGQHPCRAEQRPEQEQRSRQVLGQEIPPTGGGASLLVSPAPSPPRPPPLLVDRFLRIFLQRIPLHAHAATENESRT